MLHHMKLQEVPFLQIRSKAKTIELRLLDRKRRRISVGDTIEFLCLKDKQQKVRTRVIALHRFDSFEELYKTLPLEQCGYISEEVPHAGAQDMEKYYSKNDQKRWGVVGIELELLENWKDSETIRTSRYISMLLRHKPEAAGLTLDAHGWADVDALIKGVSKSRFLNMALLEEIVQTDDKQRYSFSEDKTKIRANQGHSVPVDVELEELQPPDVLFHGTGEKYVESILKNGLIAKNRLYVHLSTDTKVAAAVGGRHGSAVIFRVKAGQMHRDGFRFYKSVNGVWLTKYVSAAYLEQI